MRPAWAAEVVSSNVVGYEKINLSAGYNMIGVQFAAVGGNSLGISSVGTLNSEMPGFDEDGFYAAEMRIWDGNGYNTYGWSGSSGTDILEDSSMDNLWLDYTTMEPVEDEAVAGSGFWIKADQAGTMTISGEVPSATSVTIPLAAGYNMVANPYPGSVNISEFGVLDSKMAGFDADGFYATEMRVWDGNGYDTYGWSGSSGTDILEDSTLDNLWLDYTTMEPTDTALPFGTAVWIKAGEAGSITFTSPITE